MDDDEELDPTWNLGDCMDCDSDKEMENDELDM